MLRGGGGGAGGFLVTFSVDLIPVSSTNAFVTIFVACNDVRVQCSIVLNFFGTVRNAAVPFTVL